ncbi:hypothetical protein ACLBOM_32015 [Escherichia coli]
MFIFDECHRSQFGEAQKNLKKKLNAIIIFLVLPNRISIFPKML